MISSALTPPWSNVSDVGQWRASWYSKAVRQFGHDAPDGIRVLPEHLDFQLVNGGIYSNKAATLWTPQGNDVVVEQCYGFHFAGLAPEPVRGYLLQV